MILEDIKQRVADAIEENKEEIKRIGELICSNPELGYCEENTSKLIRDIFDELGIEYEYPYALTGVKAKLKGRSHNYNVCVMGEMDSVVCEGLKAHKCGHHAQVAAMLGVAIGLSKSGVMNELDGDVTLFAVPAEEFLDMEFRKSLKEQGKIKYFGGKQQLIYEGAFDDVDMAMMIHAQGEEEKPVVYVNGTSLGFTAKSITFRGKAVHGSTPFDGVNALNAASLAILGVHANRETFREEEKIRIHPIITKGGDVVNSVPDEVCIETYVRGATIEAINKGVGAVTRAVNGAAEIVGATAEIETVPGYLPIGEDNTLTDVFKNVACDIVGDTNVVSGYTITGSTDAGDLSAVLPTIQPSVGGFKGILHSKEFCVADKDTAYILHSKLLGLTAVELLFDGAKKAKQVKDNFKPKMSISEYLDYLGRESE